MTGYFILRLFCFPSDLVPALSSATEPHYQLVCFCGVQVYLTELLVIKLITVAALNCHLISELCFSEGTLLGTYNLFSFNRFFFHLKLLPEQWI